MRYPIYRSRRLRQSAALRALVRETELQVNHLVQPLFVREGKRERRPIRSMPGQFQLSVDDMTLVSMIRSFPQARILKPNRPGRKGRNRAQSRKIVLNSPADTRSV